LRTPRCRSCSTASGNEEVLVTLPEAQKLLDMPDQVSMIEANYANAADKASRDATQAAVKAKLGDTFDYNALSTSGDMFANLQVAQSLFTAFGFLALFMGVVHHLQHVPHHRRGAPP
jgi:hypothetical protein